MKNKIVLYLMMVLSVSIFANDGAYYASGNQLIPITETEICVTKEVLTIVRKIEESDTDYVYVTVEYTFFNPGVEKMVLVGFEAPSPSGDVNGFPKNGAHPYISKFDVKMNGQVLAFKTAMVNTENYYINNKIDAKTEKEVIGEDFNSNAPGFYYVYHFNAKFKPGINTIKHTYRFDMSGSVMEKYSFDYILTAANRWGNHQIDDFTLHIDMGSDENFYMQNTFFNSHEEWQIDNGRSVHSVNQFTNKASSQFITYTGGITFKKKNFQPKGELYVDSPRNYVKENFEIFDYKAHNLPQEINFIESEKSTCVYSINEKSFKILRNFPFAIRGYIFKTKFIQEYYLSQRWYRPNSEYIVNLADVSEEENEWLSVVKLNEWNK